ncbi:MAG: hypothetical protein NC302_09615 [Bacteroidales bacterium]|nr:hypothetical protein [Bacteroidales bacterium]MCM1415950.1 hypothetical protein [bacterium]MCM1423556.1 hypothetical protein [bacterium]
MSNMISPFQMKKNRVVSFEFRQSETAEEYERRKVAFVVDYKTSDVFEASEVMRSELHLLIHMEGRTDLGEELFRLELDMMGVFEGDCDKIDRERFLNMLKVNGLSTLIQLSRAYVTASTALSGFVNPIHFPMINVYELVKMKEKEQCKTADT